jgi:hypothetical protein
MRPNLLIIIMQYNSCEVEVASENQYYTQTMIALVPDVSIMETGYGLAINQQNNNWSIFTQNP